MDQQTRINYLLEEKELFLKVVETITKYVAFEKEQFNTIFGEQPTNNDVVNQALAEWYIGSQIIKETLTEICLKVESLVNNRKLERLFDEKEEPHAQPTNPKD